MGAVPKTVFAGGAGMAAQVHYISSQSVPSWAQPLFQIGQTSFLNGHIFSE